MRHWIVKCVLSAENSGLASTYINLTMDGIRILELWTLSQETKNVKFVVRNMIPSHLSAKLWEIGTLGILPKTNDADWKEYMDSTHVYMVTQRDA